MGNIALKTMLRRIIFQNPAVELEPYSVNRYDKTVIVTGEVSGNTIAPIVIIDESEQQEISALLWPGRSPRVNFLGATG